MSPTDKICQRNLSSKIPVDMNSIILKLYVIWPTWPKRSHTSEIWIFEVIFVDFRQMKNIICNKTETFVGRNTSNHACQIFCSKSNCETASLIFPPRDYRGQKNEQSECLLRSTAIYTHGSGLKHILFLIQMHFFPFPFRFRSYKYML